jgi:hypothetical protein
MPVYLKQEEDSDTKVEDEDYVTQKSQIQGNEKKEWMEDLEVKTLFTSELQMMTHSLSDNYKKKEFGI